MQTASIPLAFIVVLSFVSEAAAASRADVSVKRNYTVIIAGQPFGFVDGETEYWTVHRQPYHEIRLGPLGCHEVPFTATQGLVGFCVILATLVILPLVLKARWKRKQPSQL
jgi:hypothetical protein